jgi:glycyl-tRNA synthetase
VLFLAIVESRYRPEVVSHAGARGHFQWVTETARHPRYGLITKNEDGTENAEERIFLKLPKDLAPNKVAIFPLLKNKEALTSKAKEIFLNLKKENIDAVYDETGSIVKRYRKQDEIGTPYCVTVDFDTLENDTVTIRDRDTGEQKRIKIEEIKMYL